MTIPWVTGIPANTPATDQPDMKDNNDNLPIYTARDHVAFGASNAGYHEQVHMQDNKTTPGLGGAKGVLYANVGSGISQLFWDNGTTNQQISPNTLAQTTNGYIKIGTVMIQWGTNNVLGNATPSIPFSPSFSSACFVVFTNMKSSTSNSSTYAYNYAAANFTLRNGSGVAQDISWVAIGPV